MDYFEEAFKRFWLHFSVTKQQNRVVTIKTDLVAGDAIGNLSNGYSNENIKNLHI